MSSTIIARLAHTIFFELGKQFRMSYVPPLMVYLAAGVSGLTGIVGTFFIKDYLDLSAGFIASLGFWAGIPWALKMPLGHLVDLIWRWKFLLVYLGAALIAASIAIMYGLIAHTLWMATLWSINAWYVLSVLLAPIGYVVQDVVADAMTVEAVPIIDETGQPLDEKQIKLMHTTMQTLGRIAIISGFVLVAALNIVMFSGIETMSETGKSEVYARIYLLALAIPIISIIGVTLGEISTRKRILNLRDLGVTSQKKDCLEERAQITTKPNWKIFGGSLIFVALTISIGLSQVPFDQEIIFVGSMVVVIFLMRNLILELPSTVRGTLVGTATIIFMFRAMPAPGAGTTWWEIDILGFDQQFLSVLSLITSCLTLAGMLALRSFMATNSIAVVVFWLTIATAILSLPNIGLYYGLHEWTSIWSNGVIDARFIAIFDTLLESPLGQISMIPMLAWIAKNAPSNLKATFFAVFASFTNLALSASNLGTKYLNQFFTITREVRDKVSGEITTTADYTQLGHLLITVAIISLVVPVATILLVQRSSLKTEQ